MNSDEEKNLVEQKYQGKEMLTTIQAPSAEDLDDMLEGMEEYAEEEGLGDFTILEKGEDKDGGYRAIVAAHNWNPFTWAKEKLAAIKEKRHEKKREKERETYATVKPYVKRETDTIDVKKALVAGVGPDVLRRAGVAKAEIKEVKEEKKIREVKEPKELEEPVEPEEPEDRGDRVEAALGGFVGEAERGAERVERGLGKAIETGVGGVEVAKRRGEEVVEVARGLAEEVLAPLPEEVEIKQGDRVAYPVGIVTGYGEPQPAWRVIRSPYLKKEDTELALGNAPSDAKEVKSLGEAYKTIERLTGKSPKDLFMQLSQLDGQTEQTELKIEQTTESEPEAGQPLAPPRTQYKNLMKVTPVGQTPEPKVQNVTI